MTEAIERAARALMNVYGQPGEITEKFAIELSIAVIDSVLLDPSEEIKRATAAELRDHLPNTKGILWQLVAQAALRAAGLAITGRTET